MAWVHYSGHALIDVKDKTTKILTNLRGNWYGGRVHNPYPELVSNDGSIVVIGKDTSVIETNKCGYAYEESFFHDATLFAKKDLCKVPSHMNVYDGIKFSGYGTDYKWIDDGKSFKFLYRPYLQFSDYNSIYFTVELNASSKQVTYLALGDSYTSGEGDMELSENGESYYTKGTEDVNGCHISTRSFPFLLHSKLSLTPTSTNSVSCSGARVSVDYHPEPTTYYGQHGQLETFELEQRQTLQEKALGKYTPGVVGQIEFIKQHKPSFITVTGGGNDVGFGDILVACAAQSSVLRTCEQLKSGTSLNNALGTSIQNQFDAIVKFVKAAKVVSPKTKIFYVGYPYFVMGNKCLTDDAALNGHEREMINNAVAYMNLVIKEAAAASGAVYLDITDSLAGGRICEGSDYVTSFRDVPLVDVINGSQRSALFHPNHLGHEQISQSIIANKEFVTDSESVEPNETKQAPALPDEFGTNKHGKARYEKLTQNKLEAGKNILITVTGGSFTPTSYVRVSLFSDEKKLGKHRAELNGALAIKRNLPADIPTGFHALLVSGTGVDGKPLSLYQVVYVDGNSHAHQNSGKKNHI